ncbi:MAG: thioredoxin [Aestuariibacter sp.]
MDNMTGAPTNIVTMTEENFQEIILEVSKQKLVVVDFWADWCEPCKTLMPMLEKLAGEYSNDLVLAKVNCDEQQGIAMQFGVRNLPTVILVKDGQPVDGFAGAQQESEIRALLDKHLPKPEDGLFAEAQTFLVNQDFDQAFPLLKQAFDLAPQRTDIKFTLIDSYIELGRIKQAKELLDSVGLVDQDANYAALQSKIELAEKASETPEIIALQEALQKAPDDMQLKVDLAVQYQQNNKSEEALTLLLEVLKKDLNFGEAKKLMIDSLNALPEGDPLASQFRRKLYALLY